MVRIRDEGSEFEAPLEVVWRFLGSPETHLGAHEGERNHRIEKVYENTLLARWETRVGDEWVPVTNRVTLLPPVATLIETLEGPWTGTKLVHVYSPAGPHTRVDVYGDFVMAGRDDADVERVAAEGLGAMFEMDRAAIRRFAKTP